MVEFIIYIVILVIVCLFVMIYVCLDPGQSDIVKGDIFRNKKYLTKFTIDI